MHESKLLHVSNLNKGLWAMEFANKILQGQKPSSASKENSSQILKRILANFEKQRLRKKAAGKSTPQTKPVIAAELTATSSIEPSNVQRQENPSKDPVIRSIVRSDLKLGWRSDCTWQVGASMQNLGNSCFMNAALQCLLHAPAFHDWLRFGDIDHQNSSCAMSGNKCIICILHQTAQSAQKLMTITPQEMFGWLSNIPGHNFIMGKQDDAYLYLCGLINAMETAYLSRIENAALSTIDTPMHHLFNGNIRNEVYCGSCEQTRPNYETFVELILNIKDMHSMDEAILKNFQHNSLPDYKCESCGQTNANSTNRNQINELPLLLRVQLRRFVKTVVPMNNAEKVVLDERVTESIEPPLQMDLSDYCVPELASVNSCTYRLVAAAIHHAGITADTGHYTALGCAPTSNGDDDINFHLFDDGMLPMPLPKDLIPRYLAQNGYFFIYELMEKAAAPMSTEK